MPNRLASEPSLYLRQHGEDPVEWYPWSEDALRLARDSGRPILLSVGYSACHWCHVMARESFSDPAIAALMNRHFVSIKVDREERPDIDRVYQLAHQALQRRAGGWPLTVFLDPHDLLPFFVGTYFPPQRRQGLPAFSEVLEGLSRWYHERPDERAEQSRALAGFLRDYGAADPRLGALGDAPIAEAAEAWLKEADTVAGGRQGAPKFPHPSDIRFALEVGSAALREHAWLTLSEMARGGLQDQLGGGFFRYSVDAGWQIPHFEKMLYDNAQLLPLYACRAAQGDLESRRAANGIVSWLQEEMALPTGGFAAALDADSDHQEGAFYLWQSGQWESVVPEADRAWLAQHLGLDGPPNFEGQAWHLRIAVPLGLIAEQRGESREAMHERRKRCCRAMRLLRAQRTAPGRDDKCLVGWNALLLSGVAIAGRRMARPEWLDQAQQLADVLAATFWRDGRLLSVANDGLPRQPAFLDDYASLLLGLLDLVESRWKASHLDLAAELADAMLENFEDADFGGLWFTAHDQPALPQRPKPFIDEATPAGNGMAAQALLRLGALLAEPRYLQAAERILRAAWPTLEQLPQACASLLLALDEYHRPRPVLIARLGDTHEYTRWREALEAHRSAGARVLVLPAEESLLPDALEDKRWLRGGRVYWCEGLRCLPRFDSPVALLARLPEPVSR